MRISAALTALCLAAKTFAADATYEESLHNMLMGNIDTNNNEGAHVDYYSHQPHNATVNISIASINNGEVLNGAVQLYESATQSEKWGDAVFLNFFMKYNGQAYNYLDFQDLKNDLIVHATGNDTLLNIWAETSSDDGLAKLYNSLRGLPVPVKSLKKRDYTTCDNNHSPNQGDCNDLQNWLWVNGGSTASTGPRDYCWGGCCISWSRTTRFSLAWGAGKADWCIDHCVSAGASCEIHGVLYGNASFDFCVSNRADGCD